jgi:hypothetical protein
MMTNQPVQECDLGSKTMDRLSMSHLTTPLHIELDVVEYRLSLIGSLKLFTCLVYMLVS